jgi:hypothetical protein
MPSRREFTAAYRRARQIEEAAKPPRDRSSLYTAESRDGFAPCPPRLVCHWIACGAIACGAMVVFLTATYWVPMALVPNTATMKRAECRLREYEVRYDGDSEWLGVARTDWRDAIESDATVTGTGDYGNGTDGNSKDDGANGRGLECRNGTYEVVRTSHGLAPFDRDENDTGRRAPIETTMFECWYTPPAGNKTRPVHTPHLQVTVRDYIAFLVRSASIYGAGVAAGALWVVWASLPIWRAERRAWRLYARDHPHAAMQTFLLGTESTCARARVFSRLALERPCARVLCVVRARLCANRERISLVAAAVVVAIDPTPNSAGDRDDIERVRRASVVFCGPAVRPPPADACLQSCRRADAGRK